MGNPQKINFRSVANFLAHLPPEELKLVEALRDIIRDTLPDAREKLAYNVPFYYRHRRICYLWPASVPWGRVKEGVIVGFVRGGEMGTLSPTPSGKGLDRVTFLHPSDIDEELLRAQLFEAAELDDLSR